MYKSGKGKRKGTITGCWKSILLLVLIFSLLSFSGCSSVDSFRSETLGQGGEESPTTVYIGVFEPMTGEFSNEGKLEVTGIELAHELYPEVMGMPVELVYADNRSSVEFAAEAAQDLVDADVSIVLGSYGNTLSLAGGNIFQEAEVPAISITGTNPLVSGSNEYYFNISLAESIQGAGAAYYIHEKYPENFVAILREAHNDFYTSLSQEFNDTLNDLTGSDHAVSRMVTYPAGTEDFSSYLDLVEKATVQIVYLPCSAADAAKILKQAKDRGMTQIFIGPDTWEEQDLVSLDPAAAEDVTFTSHYSEGSVHTARTIEFLEAYVKKFGSNVAPTRAEALAFDSYLLALDAISRASGATKGHALQVSLAGTAEFMGATGVVTMNKEGNPTRSILIKKVKNGEYVFIEEQKIIEEIRPDEDASDSEG
ncbi:MAG: hypothetical protein E7224_00045 [Clostridiales bacterium]|nr:hypothetical protein [Clostridiales bacterium]